MKMLVNEKFADRKVSLQAPAPSENALIVTIAFAFLFLHILAGAILQNASASKAMPPQEETRPSLYD
jgi:hypothetical protein